MRSAIIQSADSFILITQSYYVSISLQGFLPIVRPCQSGRREVVAECWVMDWPAPWPPPPAPGCCWIRLDWMAAAAAAVTADVTETGVLPGAGIADGDDIGLSKKGD